MKTQKGLAVAAGAVTLVAMAATGCSVDFNPGSSHETRSYDIPGTFPSFTIRGDSGKVEVVGTDRSGIRVQERLRWSNKKNKPKTQRTVRDGTLTLSTRCARTVIGYNACGAAYRVEVPRRTAVRLHADSGAVEVSGLTGDSLTLTSDSGSIRARGIRTRTLTATADSGLIRLDGHADTATLRADSGAIRATGLDAGKVITRSESGLVALGLTTAPDSVDVGVDSGKVELTLPDTEQGYAMSVSSDSGGQNITEDLRQNSASPHRVTIRTESGAIVVKAAGPGVAPHEKN